MATIHIEDIPPGSHIGLNLHSWQSGPNFRGLRGISPGLNCLHITIAEVVTTKYAVWLDLTVGTVICYKWDKHAQTIVAIDNSYALSSEGQANPFLLECPTEDDREWTSITTYLTPELVRTMIPLEQVVCSTTSSNVDSDASNLSHLGTTIQDHDEAEFTFLPIDLKRSWPAGAVGREITLLALDKSWLLRDTIGRFGGIDALLAQFEFCFLGVLLYSSITSFEQWNIMFKLICSAKTAISEIPAFFSGFLELIQVSIGKPGLEYNELTHHRIKCSKSRWSFGTRFSH